MLAVWEYLSEEVFSSPRALIFTMQSWAGFPILEYWSEAMCGMLQPVRGAPSIQAHFVSGSCNHFMSLADLFQAIYILFSKFLTSHCWLAGRACFGKGNQNPRETCASTQCWRQQGLWETGGKMKMLESVALESFFVSSESSSITCNLSMTSCCSCAQTAPQIQLRMCCHHLLAKLLSLQH